MISGSIQFGLHRGKQQEGLLWCSLRGNCRHQHSLWFIHQQCFLSTCTACTKAAASQLHQQPATLTVYRSLLRSALWDGRLSQALWGCSCSKLPNRAKLWLFFQPVSDWQQPSWKEAWVPRRGWSHQCACVCHLWRGGPAASGLSGACGPDLCYAEWAGERDIRREEACCRRHYPQPSEGQARVEAMGKPGIGGSWSTLWVTHSQWQPVICQCVHRAVQQDQPDVTRQGGAQTLVCQLYISELN